ncbi:hypothetical protein [Mycobacterium sp. 1245111.1]|nr:hypothetical protein [Mycobacterium sp. 1245111.1]
MREPPLQCPQQAIDFVEPSVDLRQLPSPLGIVSSNAVRKVPQFGGLVL